MIEIFKWAWANGSNLKMWTRFWRAFDVARVVPRACLCGYAWMAWRASEWFMGLKDPTNSQAFFVSVVFGAIPWVMKFYMEKGVSWEIEGSLQGPRMPAGFDRSRNDFQDARWGGR